MLGHDPLDLSEAQANAAVAAAGAVTKAYERFENALSIRLRDSAAVVVHIHGGGSLGRLGMDRYFALRKSAGVAERVSQDTPETRTVSEGRHFVLVDLATNAEVDQEVQGCTLGQDGLESFLYRRLFFKVSSGSAVSSLT